MTRDDEQYPVPAEHLWDLVERTRALADDKEIDMPYLSPNPRVAYAQGLNAVAEELSDLLLAAEDAANKEGRQHI